MGTEPAALQVMNMVTSPEAMGIQDERAVFVENVLVEILPDRKVETAALENHDELRVRMTKTEQRFKLYELSIYPQVDLLLSLQLAHNCLRFPTLVQRMY
jgi:hypothetical protein